MLDDTAEVVPSIDELSRFTIVALSSKRKRVCMMCWLVLCAGYSDKQNCAYIFYNLVIVCFSIANDYNSLGRLEQGEYELRADSSSDAQEWIDTLRRVIKGESLPPMDSVDDSNAPHPRRAHAAVSGATAENDEGDDGSGEFFFFVGDLTLHFVHTCTCTCAPMLLRFQTMHSLFFFVDADRLYFANPFFSPFGIAALVFQHASLSLLLNTAAHFILFKGIGNDFAEDSLPFGQTDSDREREALVKRMERSKSTKFTDASRFRCVRVMITEYI